MGNPGRPRLTPEEYQARLDAYCARYQVRPTPEGIPPFPAGQRETPQHREWIKLYKAHHRLGRRQRGQCERCGSPVSDGSVFCDSHRAASSGRAGGPGANADQRRALLAAQGGHCPICSQPVDLWDSVDHRHETRQLRAIVHARCGQLLGFAEVLGPEALDRARDFLWPKSKAPRRR
jgi:hypothetical protein